MNFLNLFCTVYYVCHGVIVINYSGKETFYSIIPKKVSTYLERKVPIKKSTKLFTCH
jgi:hypothetical protein